VKIDEICSTGMAMLEGINLLVMDIKGIYKIFPQSFMLALALL